MNCRNCGTANDDGAVFCSNCGKSPNAVVRNQPIGSSDGYPLSNLTAKMFPVLFEIILWIILIGGFIGGSILGSALSHTFSGMILGGIVGFIIVILAGGRVSQNTNLVNNSEEIKRQLREMQRQS